MDTHQWLFEDLRVLMDGGWVHSDTISLPHQMDLAVRVSELGVFLDVSHHKHSAGQAHGLLTDGVWNK